MADAPEPGAGDVPIMLGGQEHVLKATLGACIGISKLTGGLNAAVVRCNQLHFETIVEIIALGLSASSLQQKKQVEELVFTTGLINVAAQCILFIRVVANGGRVPKDDGDGDAGDRPLGEPSPSTSTTSS